MSLPVAQIPSFSLASCIENQRGDHRLQAHTQGGCATKHESLCKVQISITFRKVQRHSHIADTQNVADDSSRGSNCYLGNASYCDIHTLLAVSFIDTLDPATDSRYLWLLLCTSTYYYWGNASVPVNKYPPSHKRVDNCTAPRVPELKILFSSVPGTTGIWELAGISAPSYSMTVG